MSRLADKLYRRVASWRGRAPKRSVPLSFAEMLHYVWQRGGRPWLRGLWWRIRFRQCGARLLAGRRLNILFPRRIVVGNNVLLGDYSFINGLARDGIRIGNNVSIREFAWIQATSVLDELGVGLVIGDNTYIGPRSILGAGGGITIGENVAIGAGANILAENHEFRDPARPIHQQGVTRRGIVIEEDVWIGNGVTVLDGVRIGEGAVVGAASVVTKDVAPRVIVVGNPARVVGHREQGSGDGQPSETGVIGTRS